MLNRISKLPLLATILTLIAVGVMTWLGFWQLDRAEQKLQREKQIEARQQQGFVSLDEISGQNQDLRDQPLRVTGRFETQKVLLWDNRIYEGQVGYEVLGIFNTSYGNLLVNLGWTPAPRYRDELPDVALPQGQINLQGVVVMPQANPMIRESEQQSTHWPLRIQQPSLVWLEEVVAMPLMPFILQLTDTTEFGYQSNWKPVVMPAQKHYGYAVQWFGLALACLMVFIVALYKKNKGKMNETDL